MSETQERKKVETPEESAASKIEAYLQGPRKKRKNYVVLATGEGFDRDMTMAIEGFVKKNYPQLALSNPKTTEELTRQFGRNISLLIINDQFADPKVVMNLIRALKEKRRNEVIPVLFLTRDGEKLVDLYHKELFLYHETDDYVVYQQTPKQQLLARIKAGVETQNRRKSRRYPVDIDISFFHLTKDQFLPGKLVDISLHGAVLSGDQNTIFRVGDQVKISVPVNHYLPTGKTGDFIRISGRIRRVFISGNRVALSFEHVTDVQSQAIGELILSLVSQHFSHQTSKMKGSGGPSAASGKRR